MNQMSSLNHRWAAGRFVGSCELAPSGPNRTSAAGRVTPHIAGRRRGVTSLLRRSPEAPWERGPGSLRPRRSQRPLPATPGSTAAKRSESTMRTEISTARRWLPQARGLRELCGRSASLMRLLTTRDGPRKKALTLGDFILGVYDGCGRRRARAIVRLALDTRLVRFLAQDGSLVA